MFYTAGIDAGAVSVKLVVRVAESPSSAVVHAIYRRHKGRLTETVLEILESAHALFPGVRVAATGAGAKRLAERLGLPHLNELLALVTAVTTLHPDVASLIEMGGEDAKFLALEQGAIQDFSLNSVCAAGTGAFLDQQAERMRLSIEDFASLARDAAKPARIAGRCSVFAKSDMIHLQQIATPLEDIVAGLCFAVARNVKATIIRNRPLRPIVAFAGGVALNLGMVRAFREVLDLRDLLIPDHPELLAATGAALKAADCGLPLDPAALAAARKPDPERGQAAQRPPLRSPGDGFDERHPPVRIPVSEPPCSAETQIPGYLGIDIGSISTCLAVIDQAGRLLGKRYVRTASQPIEAVRTGLAAIDAELGQSVAICGVGTTGSGRYMIADFLDADVAKNEITAQARGAVALDAESGARAVDTIFEIGGQDSKYIELKDGIIVNFEMNKACAAGTGAFLEEQAEKLDIAIETEFADLALASETPCGLGERCTVFMENSLLSALQQGAATKDLLAGLAYSIVENYMNRVVAGRPVGERIFFQGGTAFNKAVVAAFEQYLGRPINVPDHHDVSGAIGMALIARDHVSEKAIGTRFAGFAAAQRPYTINSFECAACDNRCEINRVSREGRKRQLYYGGRCEKYERPRSAASDSKGTRPSISENLFLFREQALEAANHECAARFAATGQPAKRGVVGLPRVFLMHEWLPYYATLLWELGFEVKTSERTTRAVVSCGVRLALADACLPVKAAFGHLSSLLDAGVDKILLPSFVNMSEPDEPFDYGHTCPLTQSFPYLARVAFPSARILAPVVQARHGRATIFKEYMKVFSSFGVGRRELVMAMDSAAASQESFQTTLAAKGTAVLATLGPAPALVIVGRAYNSFDAGMNLDIPKKLARLNVQALPMDFLPLPNVALDWPDMYWRSGQRILAALRAVRQDARLHALYIGNFSCGPDSFLLAYAERELAGKPWLHVEIDEHSADAGVITRCEAFLDSLAMRAEHDRRRGAAVQASARPVHLQGNGRAGPSRRRVHIPRMGDQAYGMQAAFEACGVEAVVMDRTDAATLALGRKWISGKECFPFAVTTADMLKVALAPGFEPDREAFFMPSGTGPCRFGQYNVLQKMILAAAGFPATPILSPVQDASFYKEVGMIGKDFSRLAWRGIVAVELLTRCVQATRPYEREPGAADALYASWLLRLRATMAGRDDALAAVLALMRRDFERLPRTRDKKPLIGIVGEIFVRTNTFSNENLVRRVESLGGEAWLSGIDEWVYYVNWCGWESAKQRRDFKRLLQLGLVSQVQKRIARRLERPLHGFLQTIHDPPIARLLANAAPYLHASFRGEAVLSLGKAVDMIERGASGVVNAMPFGCMPGTVVSSLLRHLSESYGTPAISIAYDGSPSPTTELQLEAFVEQARRR